MTSLEAAEALDSLQAPLASAFVLQQPCQYVSSLCEAFRDILSGTAENVPNTKGVNVADEYIEDETTVERQKLINCAVRLRWFLMAYLSGASNNQSTNADAAASASASKTRLILNGWVLIHLDAIHSQLCVYVVNLYVLLLGSSQEAQQKLISKHKNVLSFPREFFKQVYERNRADEELKKTVTQISLKLSKMKPSLQSLFPAYVKGKTKGKGNRRSSLAMKLVGKILEEYLQKSPSISEPELLHSIQRLSPLDSYQLSTHRMLETHSFSLSNFDFLKIINLQLQRLLCSTNIPTGQIRCVTVEEASTSKTFRYFLNTLNNSQVKEWTRLVKSGLFPDAESDEAGVEVRVIQSTRQSAMVLINELCQLTHVEVNSPNTSLQMAEIRQCREKIAIPSGFTSSFSFLRDRMFLYYPGVAVNLSELVHKSKPQAKTGSYLPNSGLQRGYVFNEYECLEVTLSVLQALRFLHSQSLCHGNLTPSSVLFTSSPSLRTPNSIKLAVSNTTCSINKLETTGGCESLSEVFYKSPRKLLSPQKSTQNDDIYALGVMVFELLYCNHTLSGRFDLDIAHSKPKSERGSVSAQLSQTLELQASERDQCVEVSRAVIKGFRLRPLPNVDKPESFLVDYTLKTSLIDLYKDCFQPNTTAKSALRSAKRCRDKRELQVDTNLIIDGLLGNRTLGENAGFNASTRQANAEANKKAIQIKGVRKTKGPRKKLVSLRTSEDNQHTGRISRGNLASNSPQNHIRSARALSNSSWKSSLSIGSTLSRRNKSSRNSAKSANPGYKGARNSAKQSSRSPGVDASQSFLFRVKNGPGAQRSSRSLQKNRSMRTMSRMKSFKQVGSTLMRKKKKNPEKSNPVIDLDDIGTGVRKSFTDQLFFEEAAENQDWEVSSIASARMRVESDAEERLDEIVSKRRKAKKD